MFNFHTTYDLPKWLLVLLSSIVALLIGVADYVNGIEINLSILYLIPIAYLAWFVSRPIALIFSMVSAIEWFLADLLYGHTYENYLIPYWNALVWLSFFVIFVLVISALKNTMLEEKKLSRHDFLTGVFNRRAFYEILLNEIQRSIRYKHALTLAYIDCDNFKQVNDQYGHKTGDMLLKILSETITINLRNVDVIARLGGDEFVLLLPESNYESSHIVIKKLQKLTNEMMKRKKWNVTLSIGACTYTEPPLSYEAAIQYVDKLMYEAKKAGKNKIMHQIA